MLIPSKLLGFAFGLVMIITRVLFSCENRQSEDLADPWISWSASVTHLGVVVGGDWLIAQKTE